MIIKNINTSKIEKRFLYNSKLKRATVYLIISAILIMLLNICDVTYFFINPSTYIESLVNPILELYDLSSLSNENLAVFYKVFTIGNFISLAISFIAATLSIFFSLSCKQYAYLKPSEQIINKRYIIRCIIISLIMFLTCDSLIRFLAIIATFSFIKALRIAIIDNNLLNVYEQNGISFNSGVPNGNLHTDNEVIEEKEPVIETSPVIDTKREEDLNNLYEQIASLENEYRTGLIDETTYLDRKNAILEAFGRK